MSIEKKAITSKKLQYDLDQVLANVLDFLDNLPNEYQEEQYRTNEIDITTDGRKNEFSFINTCTDIWTKKKCKNCKKKKCKSKSCKKKCKMTCEICNGKFF